MGERLRNYPDKEPRRQIFEGTILGNPRRGRTARDNPLYSFDIAMPYEEGLTRRTVVRRKKLTDEIRNKIVKDEKVVVVGTAYVARKNQPGRGNKPIYRISAFEITFSDGTKA